MKTPLLALFLAASSAALGADAEFDHVVKAIESHFGTKRTHVPFMGLASLVVKVGHPAGTTDFKLAVFEDLKSSPGYRERDELDQFMHGISSRELRPLVRVHSRRDGESVYIYAGETGRSTQLLLATFARNEATVVAVKVDMKTLLKWLNSPDDI